MQIIRELQPEIDEAAEKYRKHRMECAAPRRNIEWSSKKPSAREIFQPYDCAECDRLYDELFSLVNVSPVRYITEREPALWEILESTRNPAMP